MNAALRKIRHFLLHPNLIPTYYAEKRMTAAYTRFRLGRTQADNDTEREAFFAGFGDIALLVEEARQTPIYLNLVAMQNKDNQQAKVITSQTTSLDDCISIYVLIRLRKPQVMVETGVFYGGMSAMILHAMQRNGGGRLYSIDLPVEADGLDALSLRGALVTESLRPNWELILGDSRIELPKLLQRLGKIDAFNHDSLHTTGHMTWEFEMAWPHIRSGGTLSSHDVLMTPSWSRFLRRHKKEIDQSGRVYCVGIAYKRA